MEAMDPIQSNTAEVVDPQKRNTKQRVDALEMTTTRLCYGVDSLEEKVEVAETEIRRLHIQLDESRRACTAMNETVAILPDMRDEMEALRAQLLVLQRVVGNGQAPAREHVPRLRIPEPCTYGGAHDAKEVENFLFDMEQYFLAALIEDEARKVTIATMYLGGDAKLWWRTKYADIQANRVRIDSWDLLKEAIRSQFFPKKVEYQARRALRELKHTSSIREYVKAFSGHMLNIRDMSEKDKLFTFMEGLKPWTRTELQRQKVTDLSAAMGAAECLSDYQPESRKDRPSENSQAIGGGSRPYRPNSNSNVGERYFNNKGGAYQGIRQSNFQGNYQNSRQGNYNGWNKEKATEDRSDVTPKLMCFLCEGPHRVAKCPLKRMVNAYCQLAGGGMNSKQDVPQASCYGETDSEEDYIERTGNSAAKNCIMEAQLTDAVPSYPCVRATIHLGSETFFVQANNGVLSEQLVSVKEQSMSILKDFITKHNIPTEVPDEPEEVSSEDDNETSSKPPIKKSKSGQ